MAPWDNYITDNVLKPLFASVRPVPCFCCQVSLSAIVFRLTVDGKLSNRSTYALTHTLTRLHASHRAQLCRSS